MSNAESPPPTPPYVAYRTFRNFLASIAPAIPSRIDKHVMASMSGSTQAQLMHALRYLRLIDDVGTPTEKLRALAVAESNDDEYQSQLLDLLKEAYSFFDEDFDIQSATEGQLDDQFAKVAKGDTARKCKTFFIPAAKDAGMEISRYIRDIGKRSPSSGKTKRTRAARPKKTQTQHDHENRSDHAPQAPLTPSWNELLLAKFPTFDPAWPDELKVKWFESFQELQRKGGGDG